MSIQQVVGDVRASVLDSEPRPGCVFTDCTKEAVWDSLWVSECGCRASHTFCDPHKSRLDHNLSLLFSLTGSFYYSCIVHDEPVKSVRFFRVGG